MREKVETSKVMFIGFIVNTASTGGSGTVETVMGVVSPEVAKFHPKFSEHRNTVAVAYLKAHVFFWAYCFYIGLFKFI